MFKKTYYRSRIGTRKSIGMVRAIYLLFIIKGVTATAFFLSPTFSYVEESDNFTLKCSYRDSNGPFEWTNSKTAATPVIMISNNTCRATGDFSNDTLYDIECAEKSVSVSFKNIGINQIGNNWTCGDFSISSSMAYVLLKVPVKSADITNYVDEKVSIIENSSTTFMCHSVPSRPIPTVSWFLSYQNTKKIINITDASNQSLPAGDSLAITEVESVLKYVFNRSHNGSHIYCQASNVPDRSVNSSSKLLFIIYPPDEAPALTGTQSGGVLSIVEYQQGKLSCTVSGGNPPANLSWHCFNGYVTESHENGKVISNITWTVLRKQHNESCTCMSEHIFGDLSTSVNVKVLYSPDKPTFSIQSEKVKNIIEVIQNNSLNVVCKSNSNPNSDYKWTMGSYLMGKGKLLTITRTEKKDSGEYECIVNNTMIGSNGLVTDGRNSSKFTLYILFPPNYPTFRYTRIDDTLNESVNGRKINVIQGDEFKIICQSIGHPPPTHSWGNAKSGNTSMIIAGNSMNKTCTATNTMTETVGETRQGSASSTLFLDVLYAPTMQQIYIHNNTGIKQNISDNLRVIEKESFNLSCTSQGNPIPIYKWNVNSSEVSIIQELVRMDISRQQSGIYTCRASNTMVRTFGERKIGTSVRNITVDVLYPAEVGELTDTTVVEGNSINVTCPVILGNPQEATVKWTPGSDFGRLSSDSTRLFISNTSRNDEKIYSCSVTTLMRPTYGLQKAEINYGQFQLIVNYKARVIEFYIGEESDRNVYTVNETENVTFICGIDSKPAPTATILLNDNIVHISDKSNFTYRREYIQCIDFGLYQCTGINKYNHGSQSFMNITLYVNCSPRPSHLNKLQTNVTSARNTMATFSFTALAYPEPGPAGFMWSFMNGSDRTSLSNRSNVFILNTQVQSNLVIRNVTHESYGQYILRINNTMGVFEQSFYLKPLDVPMAPAISNWTSGEAHINISVKAGFNGGLPQWFYLKYKQLLEEGWISETIVNTTSKEFNYTIDRLSSGQSYQLVLFAGNIKGNSTHVSIIVKTEHKENAVDRDNFTSTTAAVAGSLSGVAAVIVVIVIAGLLYKKRRHDNDTGKLLYQNIPFTGNIQNKKNKCEKSKVEETPLEELQDIDDVPKVTHEPVEYYNSQDVLETIDRIKVSALFSYLTGKDEDSFGIDYQKLPTGLEKPCTFARKPEHLAKNRYNGIYPYDHSRVKLHGDPDFFINACYIDGYKRTKAYIASLGPTAKTTSDFKTFWQMIWHEQSDIIVMLTNLREPSGMKCEKYWPDYGERECYGDITVACQHIEIFAEYTVRIFSVLKDDESRTVTHLHYTAWPDKKVPEDTMSLLEFRQRIKITPTGSKGPVVVHCSAGIGRTGTLIALDRLIEEGQCEGSVNVYECVLSMREQRVKMVQTLEQYIYIYKALVSALVFDSETIPLESYEEYMDTTSNTTYSYQFKQLQQSVDTESKEEIESRIANGARTTQNRLGADIPAAHGRVFLYMNREADDSDYINAVYMNSFKRQEYFIVAQSPLPNTVVDFICMLYQEDCTCIVSMEDMKEPGTSVGVFLPSDGHTLKFGNFIVSCTRLEMSHYCIVRKVIIKLNGKNENGEKTSYHFQYTNWMLDHDCPMNASEFVQFVTEVEEYANQFCEERSHVLVHCLKANERSGLFCAVTTLIEKLKYERQVNVLNTLRHIRTRRKTSITSMEQLKFCFQTGSVYIKMFRP